MREIVKKKKIYVIVMLLIAIVAIGLVFCFMKLHGSQKQQTEGQKSYESFSQSDKETATLYATLYEVSVEKVATIQAKTKNWQKTSKRLEQDFFTIPENTKYQMAKEGYSLDDLKEAEKLSVKNGIKAMQLIKAKGKASEHKKWSDVLAQ